MCRCYAVINSVFRCCTRPNDSSSRESLWNAYEGAYGHRYHAVVAPNGLSIDFYGPEPGKYHDLFLLNMSGLKRIFPLLPSHASGTPYYIYGSSRHDATPYLRTPNIHPFRTAEDIEWTRKHNAALTYVQKHFQCITDTFPVLKYIDRQTPCSSPVGVRYHVAVLLTNCKNCLIATENPHGYGNSISKAFECKPPTLDEYLSIPDVPRRQLTRY